MFSTYATNYLNPGSRAQSYQDLITFGQNNSFIKLQEREPKYHPYPKVMPNPTGLYGHSRKSMENDKLTRNDGFDDVYHQPSK